MVEGINKDKGVTQQQKPKNLNGHFTKTVIKNSQKVHKNMLNILAMGETKSQLAGWI